MSASERAGGGLHNYIVQAQDVVKGDQCNDASWTAISDAHLNIMGATQQPTPPSVFVQVVVQSWEDGSTHTRIWTDPTTKLTVQRP